jgi:hypothetical protein
VIDRPILLILGGIAIVIVISGLAWRFFRGQKHLDSSGLPPRHRRAQADYDTVQHQLRDLKQSLELNSDRLASVTRDVRELQRAQAAAKSSSHSSHPGFGQSESSLRRVSEREPTQRPLMAESSPLPLANILPIELSTLIDEVVQAFNLMVESPNLSDRTKFYTHFKASADDGSSQLDVDSVLAWIPGPSPNDEGLLVPGHAPSRDWAKSYRGEDGAQARKPLEIYFDITPGLALQMIEPARARLGADGRPTVIARGRLA